MGVEEINLIRERSDGYRSWKAGKAQSCIWETDYGEMCRKTVLKRLTKYLPKTEKWEKLGQAIEIDNQEYSSTAGQDSYIESLLYSSSVSEQEKETIERQLNSGMTSGEAERIIERLKSNQLHPIQAGLPASQAAINDAVNEKLNDPNS